MHDETTKLLKITTAIILASTVGVILGMPLQLGIALSVMALAPFGFLGLLLLGIKSDEFFGVENAWAYQTVGKNKSEK